MKRRISLLTRIAAIALVMATMLAGPLGVSAASDPKIGIGKATATPDTGTTPGSSDPATIYASYLKQETNANILFRPGKGDLVHDSKKITTSSAGLDVESFIAHVEFANPYQGSSTSGFDFGILFRLGQTTHFRVIISSDGNWYLTPGKLAPIAKGPVDGLDTSAKGTNTIDLVVVGDTGYLGVNDKFITTLDLSSSSGKGDVAVGTAFFGSNFKVGASTSYKNFTVWSVKVGAPPPVEKTPPSQKTPAGDATPTVVSGEGYLSPQFSYTIAYDSTWTASSATSDKSGDYVRIANGVSSVDFAGYATDTTPKLCLADQLDFFKTTAGYTKVAIAQDTNSKDMTGTIAGGAYQVVVFSYASGTETPVDYAAYVECLQIEAGKSMLRISQFVESAKYNDQIAPFNALLAGLKLPGAGATDVTPTETTTSDVTPTETTASDTTPTAGAGTTSGAITFRLESDGSPVGLVRISANKDAAKSDVKISASDLPTGSIVLIHKGSCAKFTSDPAYYLNDFDASGNSVTIVKATLAKLTAGGYVVVVHESLDDLTKAYACGAIAS